MKLNKIIIATIMILAIFMIGAASAADEITYSADEILAIDSTDEVEMTQDLSAELSSSVEDESSLSLENSTVIGQKTVYGNGMSDIATAVQSASAGETIYLENDIEQDTSTYVMLNRAITIDGNGHTIDMKGISYAFRIHNAHVNLMNLIIINGYNTENAGAIYATAHGSCTITNCTFINNVAARGGALYLFSDNECSFSDSIFINNSASVFGGAIYAKSQININNCAFSNNNAECGGGVYVTTGASSVTNCNFTGNTARHGAAVYSQISNINNCNFIDNIVDDSGTAGARGGALYLNGTSTVSNSVFTGNRAKTNKGYGGAAYVKQNCEIINCEFANNVAGTSGGAIYGYTGASCTITDCNFTFNEADTAENAYGGAFHGDAPATFNNCIFTENSVLNRGGAVYLAQGNGNLTDCKFTDNSAGISAGAVYSLNGTNCYLTNCEFEGNTGGTGGAFYGNGTLSNCSFTDNHATLESSSGDGGAVFSFDSPKIINCIFTGNTATRDGGAILSKQKCTVDDSIFTDNNANHYGGAVYVKQNSEIINCDFTNNAADEGGAFYGNGTLSNCSFTDNHATAITNGTATGDGGAVYSLDSPKIINCIFTRNTATRDGGAILSKQKGTVEDSIFTDNNAGRYGGSIYKYDAIRCDIIDSTAKNGAGIYKGDANDCFIANCTTTNSGSAIYDGNAYDSTIINCYNSKAIVYNGAVENCIIAESPQLYCPDISANPGETVTVPVRVLDRDGNDVDDLSVDVEVYQNGVLIDSYTVSSGTTLTLDVNQPLTLALTSKCLEPLNASITLAKPRPFISAPAVTTKYGNDVNITVYLASDVPGNVWITINKAKQQVPIKNGVATYTVSGLKYGLYPVEINYKGNYKYAADTINTTLNVNKNSPITSVVANSVIHGNDATVSVNVAQNVPGNIKITVNGVTVKAPITNGVATATFANLNAKTYEVTANYAGNVNYVAQTKTASLTVTKGTPIISIDAPEASFGTDATITVNLFSDVPGNVRVTFNGVTEKAKITNGVATYTVSGLKAGTHSFSVNYAGNANYNAETVTGTLTIVKATPIESVSVENINVGDTAVVVVKMANNVNGNVRITVNGVTEKVKIVDGIATLNVTGLKAGTYDVSAYYAGNANFEAQTSTASVTVSKSSPGLSMTVVTKSGKTTVTANIASDAPGNVKVIVDGATTYTAKITNGVATYIIDGLTSGTHTIKVTYAGNYKYTAQSRTKTITV